VGRELESEPKHELSQVSLHPVAFVILLTGERRNHIHWVEVPYVRPNLQSCVVAAQPELCYVPCIESLEHRVCAFAECFCGEPIFGRECPPFQNRVRRYL